MNKFVCTRCNNTFSRKQENEFNGFSYCEECFEEATTVCDCCHERILQYDARGDATTTLCSHCEETHYTYCTSCDCLLANENAYYPDDDEYEPYCCSCYTEHQKHAIHEYSYKPDPIFYPDGASKNIRYLGVELEIDDAGKDNENAQQLLNIANARGEYIYIKADGSLEDGMELVTHPMTLAFHQHTVPWQKVMHCALTLGYKSHKTDTCGLHVHVNRDSFGPDLETQENVISRVLFLVESFWNPLLKFSRRTQYQLSRWAARYGIRDNPKQVLATAKKEGCHRYTCVNLTNAHTIEFRIFRGTLKYNTLIATLELVDELCNVAFLLSDEEVSTLSWPDFVGGLRQEQHLELIQYLKEKSLYINEPIETSIEEE